jgi:hypothetical protein
MIHNPQIPTLPFQLELFFIMWVGYWRKPSQPSSPHPSDFKKIVMSIGVSWNPPALKPISLNLNDEFKKKVDRWLIKALPPTLSSPFQI